jgi:hypothetical protein
MMRLLHDVIDQWMFEAFRKKHPNYKKTGDVKLAFAEEVVIPNLKMTNPQVSNRSYRLGKNTLTT